MLSPALNFAVTDHAVSTARGREHHVDAKSRRYVFEMRDLMREAGIRHFDIGDDDQGIVHVIGPELGLTLPGTTFLCTDSHTCTHGALGALAWGVGQTDALHILATQTIVQAKPKVDAYPARRKLAAIGVRQGRDPRDHRPLRRRRRHRIRSGILWFRRSGHAHRRASDAL